MTCERPFTIIVVNGRLLKWKKESFCVMGRFDMGNEFTMRQYGLSETVEKSAERFADLTVSRVLSQEKGIIDRTTSILSETDE